MYFKFLQSFLAIIVLLFVTACSEESQHKEYTYTGTFVDAPVSGLSYSCSSSSDLFQTDANGKFTCPVWEKAKFQLNDLFIGTASATQNIVTPYSLSPDDSLCAVNIARLLQTLDTHLEEGVLHLNKNLLEKVPSTIDCSSPNFTDDAEKALDKKLVTAEEAKKSMDSSIIDHDGNVPSTPTLAALQASVDENASSGTIIGVVSIIDKGTTEITSIQLSGLGNENFFISSIGEVKVAINAALDYETTTEYNLSALASNDAGSSNRATVQISIVDINESQAEEKAPILESANLSVQENSPENTLVGHLSIIDTGSTPITNITLTGDGNTSFLIDLDGNITVSQNANLDFELQSLYVLQALATNGVGNSNIVDVNISILDVIESTLPQLANSTASVEENSSPNTLVGHINIINVGVPPLTKITLTGEGYFNFLVATDGTITTSADVLLDYETNPLYTLQAIATNSAGNSAMVDVNISILDVNETVLTPPILTNSTASIAENSPSGTEVGTLIIDSNGSSPITTITLSGEGNLNFNVATTGLITVSADGYLDYESVSAYNLTAIATNNEGDSNSADVNITILDVQEEPILSASSLSIAENASSGTVVGYVSIVNSGASAITSMSLSGTGNSNFNITASGDITVSSNASLDYETTSSYSLSAIATNSYGSSAPVNVSISVTDYTNPFLIAKLKSNIILKDDMFGYSVAVNGEYIVVGTNNSTTETSAQLFTRGTNNSLNRLVKLSPSGTIWDDSQTTDRYQINVAINGNYILLGYPNLSFSNATNRGAAYLFKRVSDTNITQIAEITASNGVAGDNFGSSVAIDGDYLLIGATGRDVTGSTSDDGGAYIFKRASDTNVSELAMLTANDAASYDSFGNAVSINGDYLLIGADNDDLTTADEGSAYLFKRNSDSDISQLTKLIASDAQDSDSFGYAVSIDYPYFVIGTNNTSGSDSNGESAYIFKIYSDSNVSQIQKIQGSSSTTGDHFGCSVAINKNYIVVGSQYDTESLKGSEYTYIYKRAADDSITEIKKLQSNKPNAGDSFGYAVAIDTNLIAVGAVGEGALSNEGATYIFDMEPLSKPYFYNPPIDVIRNEVFKKGTIHSFTNEAASPAGSLSYSSGGTDGSHFSFSGADIYFLSSVTTDAAADYEVPVDSNSDNNYTVTVTASDPAGTTATHNLNIGIKDKAAFEIAKFNSSNAQTGDFFGLSVSTDGNYTLVGAPDENLSSTDTRAGAAYLYYKNPNDQSVSEIARITAPSPEIDADDAFGSAVAIQGNYIVIGAKNDDINGTVFVYKRNGNSVNYLTKVRGRDSNETKAFGSSVAIYNNYFVVGAPDSNDSGSFKGLSYVYEINSTDDISNQLIITSPSQNDSAYFGKSVSINDVYIVIGSQYDTNNRGIAYLYKIDTASPSVNYKSDINASDLANLDSFGTSVSINGDYIVVGSPSNDINGSAYVFKKDTNDVVDSEIKKLHETSYLHTYVNFGHSVSTNGITIAVGAPTEDLKDGKEGSVYIYDINTSNDDVYKLDKLTPSDSTKNDRFGNQVSLSGENLSIGTNHQVNQTGDVYLKGKAYIFIKDPNQPTP